MITIYKNNAAVSTSKNLRGIRRYASKHGIAAVGVTKGGDYSVLDIRFGDDATATALFHDYDVLVRWLASRKSWPVDCRTLPR